MHAVATRWAIDAAHSIAEFSVKHLVVSTVKGSFGGISGLIEFDQDHPRSAFVQASIDVSTITTGNDFRDGHLRSADFFLADEYPTMEFVSTGVQPAGEGHYAVDGDLTIRGVTLPATFDVELDGIIENANSQTRAAFTATTQISRKAYGLLWNNLIESGAPVVGDTVKVSLHIAAVQGL